MMVVQGPPLRIHDAQTQETIATEKYKTFTVCGTKLDYVVWPALLLHEDGPVLSKGVAQAVREK